MEFQRSNDMEFHEQEKNSFEFVKMHLNLEQSGLIVHLRCMVSGRLRYSLACSAPVFLIYSSSSSINAVRIEASIRWGKH